MLLKQRLGRSFWICAYGLAQIKVVLVTTVGITECLIGFESLPEFTRRAFPPNIWMVSSR
jgi:hypothetical protein